LELVGVPYQIPYEQGDTLLIYIPTGRFMKSSLADNRGAKEIWTILNGKAVKFLTDSKDVFAVDLE
jgi:hypothetical protein